MKKRRKFVIAGVVGLLYVVTGLLGPRRHLADITAQADAQYARGVKREREEVQLYTQEGMEPRESRFHPGGPNVGVDWAVPILPCVLLVNSYETLGPLCGHGGLRIVFYFGFKTFYINTPIMWIS
jgi:hypothetical protein